MDEITLMLCNDRPFSTEGVYECLFPEREPKWHFAQIVGKALTPASALGGVATDKSAVALSANARSKAVGGSSSEPVAVWVVLTNAVEGKDAEFNDWYDNQHLHDVLDVPGLVSARRFNVTEVTDKVSLPWKYLALYEIELARAAETLAEVAKRVGGPKMPNPGYLEASPGSIPFRPA